MQVATLSDSELTEGLEVSVVHERESIVCVLQHLMEFDKRLLYRELGYSSLFDYCTRKLRYSEGGAHRRITAARCLRDNPEVEALLLSGKVNLCTVATAARSIEQDKGKLEEIIGCSKREVEALVSKSIPVTKAPREVVKPLVLEPLAPLFAQNPLKEERVRLEFSVPKETYEAFKAMQQRLSAKAGKSLSIETAFIELLKAPTNRRSRRVRVRTSSHRRYIPRSVREEVYSRDHGQCTFSSCDGVRCTERQHLQFDHIVPFACGGLTEASNLRLLCPAHNRLMAERFFGKEKISQFLHS